MEFRVKVVRILVIEAQNKLVHAATGKAGER